MDGEEDYADQDFYEFLLDAPASLRDSMRCLLERHNSVNNNSNDESNKFTAESEAHHQKTIESVLKLYTDTIPGETWINFQRAAANLHRMHSLVKKRMNRVYRTSYEQGYINFSKNIIKDVKRISRGGGNRRPIPVSNILPLISSSSDPPLGTISRRERRQFINARRHIRKPNNSTPLHLNLNVLPQPMMSCDAVGQSDVYNQSEISSSATANLPSPYESDDYCNCSNCSSSSSSTSTTSDSNF